MQLSSSVIGYPVISCGFTDQRRLYQVAALFVISRRTSGEYAQCFNALARLFKEIRCRTVQVDAVMGDAEEAQANAYLSIPEFARARVLMCFFHVLFNVRKRIKHLPKTQRKIVLEAIVDMHFTESMNEFQEVRDSSLLKWRAEPALQSFATYFQQQWLAGRFWRWQAFHTPTGYTTTNNPCEVYNSSLKSFFQRRRWHMAKLLDKIRQHLSVQASVEPATNEHIVIPPTDVLDTATLLIRGGRVTVANTLAPACVRVRHVTPAKQARSRDTEAEEAEEVEELAIAESEEMTETAFAEIFGGHEYDGGESSNPPEPEDLSQRTGDLVTAEGDEWRLNVHAEREREKASKLYSSVIKWSLRRSHEKCMPEDGWVVDVDRCVCSCKYYVKLTTCAHVAVGRSAPNMSKPGVIVEKKLKSMIVCKKVRIQKAKIGSKSKKVAKKATSRHPPANGSQAIALGAPQGATLGDGLLPPATNTSDAMLRGSALFSRRQPPLFAPQSAATSIIGRPPHASSALNIQFIMN